MVVGLALGVEEKPSTGSAASNSVRLTTRCYVEADPRADLGSATKRRFPVLVPVVASACPASSVLAVTELAAAKCQRRSGRSDFYDDGKDHGSAS